MKRDKNGVLKPSTWWEWLLYWLLHAGMFLGFAAFIGLIIFISFGTAADSIAWWRWLLGY